MLLVKFVQLLQKLLQKFSIQVQNTLLFAVISIAQILPIPIPIHVLELEQFQSIANDFNEAKLIAMIFSDGGPDQNPRFPKTLEAPIQHFKKHKFDVLLVTTHDPQVCQPTIKWKVE